jgi:hypothetical protein
VTLDLSIAGSHKGQITYRHNTMTDAMAITGAYDGRAVDTASVAVTGSAGGQAPLPPQADELRLRTSIATISAWAITNGTPRLVGESQPAASSSTLPAVQRRLPATMICACKRGVESRLAR